MSRHSVDLPLSVDRAAGTALCVQLGDRLRTAMRDGTLKPGERLPSTRALARQLAVSRTVVTEAYQQLYAEGWLDGRHGSGTYVADMVVHLPPTGPAPGVAFGPASGSPPGPAPGAAALSPGGRDGSADGCPVSRPGGDAAPGGAGGVRTSARSRPVEAVRGAEGVVDLRPGQPWVLDYDRAAWRRAWRGAADLPPAADPDPYGLPRLRTALAEHLRRTRAIPVGPENVMITRGTGNGLDLVAATLLRPGDRAGVEEPGYRVARNAFAGRGAQVVPCPVDEDGVVVDDLPADLRLLYTTPAHQFPLGGRLPVPRRERLLAWARATGAVVVEDDYDAEFRYDVAPLPALYGIDPGRVVLLGSLSKALTPDIGVGWLVAPPSLLAAVALTRDDLADRTSGPAQQAVAVLLERGDLDRHLRRMRLEYARRRAAVVDILGDRVTGDTAGLHVMVELPEHEVGPLVEAARRRGVLLDSLARHHHGPQRRHGLVLGYGSASLADLRRGVATVAGLIGRPSPPLRT
ncbi:GntR family transcriptional regulator/MocR family aminotransferase [Streptosporangium becharense]|uniref:GntR family transcriptional regulator/MocR family aminotransferase n=1 Tax=Streptosporangium becharense TaxID=1816182 RepID=A0A7W9MIA9_9ACTN|nr:PLP-dependent aminotransferase family protein [Streptosporangium becharense]MBB2911157.1 GntR family transcriptional regulator/MocR family aminotransferase [Streptosporangium becharense]MBB5821785.1 GntR family transcriptional regulator/MocR family aminotransferase [Streptosporangium becharense]